MFKRPHTKSKRGDSDDDVPLIRLMDVKIIFVDDTSVQMISLRNRLQWL